MEWLVRQYVQKRWVRWAVRIAFWSFIFLTRVARIEGGLLRGLQRPPVLVAALVNTLLLILLYYVVTRLLPNVVSRRWGWLPATGIVVALYFAYQLGTRSTYYYVVTQMDISGPFEPYWRMHFQTLTQPTIWNFLYTINGFSLSVGTFLSAFGILVFKIMRDVVVDLYRESWQARRNLQLELNLLKSQINPTLLTNALRQIETLTEQHDERAPDLILKLSDVMRYTLYETSADWVPLAREVEFLGKFIDLEEARLAGAVEVDYQLLAQHLDQQAVPPLLLFPFVETAFVTARSSVYISLGVTAEQLVLEIDADCAYPRSEPDALLQNARKRLQLTYGDAARLTLRHEPDRYYVLLTLPMTPPPHVVTTPTTFEPNTTYV